MINFIKHYLWIICILLSIILYPIFDDNNYIQIGCCILMVTSMIYGGYIGIKDFSGK